jgi:enolase
LHQARQLEGQLSEYIRARTDTETAIISIKTALLQKLLPAVNTIADTVANLFTGIAEFSSYFLDELMKRFDQSVIASSLLALIKSIIAIGRRARQAHAAWLSATIGKFLGGGFVNVLPGDFAEDVEGDKGGGGIFGNNNPPGNKFK